LCGLNVRRGDQTAEGEEPDRAAISAGSGERRESSRWLNLIDRNHGAGGQVKGIVLEP
jgi:hypothetical protein